MNKRFSLLLMLSLCASAGQLHCRGSQIGRVQKSGVYRVDPIVQNKKLQATWLELKNGHRVLLSTQPNPSYFRFINKVVHVSGSYRDQFSGPQQPTGDSFVLHNITLAAGQSPNKGTQLPTPPRITSGQALKRYVGRWVHVIGQVKALQRRSRHTRTITQLHVVLTDGHSFVQREFRVHHIRWNPATAQKLVTLIGKVVKTPKKAGYTLDIGAVCQGKVPRCSMTRTSTP